MLDEFLKYTQLADQKMIKLFENMGEPPAKAIVLFSHVLNAQHIWACRILGNKSIYQVWDNHQPSAYVAISTSNFESLAHILATVDLEKEIVYKNAAGQQFVGVVKDILMHVFNHSTYHRGQIASVFKSAAVEPPVTDYIMLKRNGEL